MSTMNTHDLSGARTLLLDGERWVCLHDVVSLLGGDADSPDLYAMFQHVPAHLRKIEPLYGDGGVTESLPVVTWDGLGYALLASEQEVLSGLSATVLGQGFRSMAVASVASGAQSRSRWGGQPAREVLREFGLSVAELTGVLNAQGRGTVFRMASVSAVLLGRQLPSPELVEGLHKALQRPVVELFTAEVLAAYEKKHASRAAAPPPPSRPLPKSLASGSGPADLSSQEPQAALPPRTPPPSGMVLLSEAELDALASSPSVNLDDEEDLPVIDPASLELSDEVFAEAFGEGFSLVEPPRDPLSSSDPS